LTTLQGSFLKSNYVRFYKVVEDSCLILNDVFNSKLIRMYNAPFST